MKHYETFRNILHFSINIQINLLHLQTYFITTNNIRQ